MSFDIVILLMRASFSVFRDKFKFYYAFSPFALKFILPHSPNVISILRILLISFSKSKLQIFIFS
jgi:hypothetical protein